MSKPAEDYRKINAVMMGVLNVALAYLLHHNECFKKYCLQTSAWDGVEKLKEVATSLSEPFLSSVNACLSKCAVARERMPDINIGHKEEFPVAATSLAILSQEIDRIRESDPSLAEGITEDKLASGLMFANLAQIAVQM